MSPTSQWWVMLVLWQSIFSWSSSNVMRGGQSLLVCFMLCKFQVQHALSRSANTVCCYSAHQNSGGSFQITNSNCKRKYSNFQFDRKRSFCVLWKCDRFTIIIWCCYRQSELVSVVKFRFMTKIEHPSCLVFIHIIQLLFKFIHERAVVSDFDSIACNDPWCCQV